MAAKIASSRLKWWSILTRPTHDRASASADLEVARSGRTSPLSLDGKVAVQAAVKAQKAAEREAKLAVDSVTRITAELDIVRRTDGRAGARR